MLLRILICAGLIFSFVLSEVSYGQEADENEELTGKNVGFEAGFHVGKLLPNQIDGVTEILSLGGINAGFRLSPDSFAQFAFTTGNGSGAEWKNFSAGARLEMPIEMLVGIAYLGVDSTYYKAAGSSDSKLIFGAHTGGGVMSLLGGSTWFRADMKFGVSPGTYLFIGFGFIFRFPGSGTTGGPT